MTNTIYAAFPDAESAEKAAGALLDHGVRAEDLSVVRAGTPEGFEEPQPEIEGELSGATPYSPGVLGTGIYNPPDPTYGPGPLDAVDDDITSVRMTEDENDPRYVGPAEQPRDYTPSLHTEGVVVGSETTTVTGARGGGTSETLGFVTGEQPRDEGDHIEDAAEHGITTTTAKDAGSGAVKGAAVGLGVGVLGALAAVFIPGFGLLLGAGALAEAVAAVAAATGAGAVAGGVVGYLKDQGVEEHVAHRYGETLSGGGAVLAVQLPSNDVDEPQARQILEKYGAVHVNGYATRGGPYVS